MTWVIIHSDLDISMHLKHGGSWSGAQLYSNSMTILDHETDDDEYKKLYIIRL